MAEHSTPILSWWKSLIPGAARWRDGIPGREHRGGSHWPQCLFASPLWGELAMGLSAKSTWLGGCHEIWEVSSTTIVPHSGGPTHGFPELWFQPHCTWSRTGNILCWRCKSCPQDNPMHGSAGDLQVKDLQLLKGSCTQEDSWEDDLGLCFLHFYCIFLLRVNIIFILIHTLSCPHIQVTVSKSLSVQIKLKLKRMVGAWMCSVLLGAWNMGAGLSENSCDTDVCVQPVRLL